MDNISLTPIDVADQLRIAKNTVYELIKRGELPAYKVGRKVRIDASDLEAYKNRGKATGGFEPSPSNQDLSQDFHPSQRSQKSLLISGKDKSLDILADFLRQEMPAYPVFRSHTNSYKSLVDLYLGQTNLAASHLYDATSHTYNTTYCKVLLPSTPILIINLAHRVQGFYVLSGNPSHIQTWSDLGKSDIKLMNREKGSGSRILLDQKLEHLHIDSQDIHGYDQEVTSSIMAINSILSGKADCAIGCENISKNIPGIDFIPLQKESYDLIIKKSHMTEVIYTRIFDIINSKAFKDTIGLHSSYDTRKTGDIVYES